MLETLTVRTFKSLEDVVVDLGLVNVFIGPNLRRLMTALASVLGERPVNQTGTPDQNNGLLCPLTLHLLWTALLWQAAFEDYG